MNTRKGYAYMNILSRTKLNQSAFTIVELIIVIAVVGILAAITIVSYTNSRNQADKSAYNATAQQVKMKLGEHYTDNNYYPVNKTTARTYLDSVGANSLEDDFTHANYAYGAWTTPAKTTACTTANAANCQYYEITINKTAWNGSSADSNLVIKP